MYNENEESKSESKVFLSYDDTYDVASDGTIINSRTGKELKHAIVNSGHHRVDIHGRHTFVHRLVYQMFGERPLQEGEQVNHHNDNKEDNNIENLYAGTQKENIADCIRNGHRKGNLKQLIIRKIGNPVEICFETAKKFFDFDGHPVPKNGGVGRSITRDWFKNKYELVYFGYAADRKV